MVTLVYKPYRVKVSTKRERGWKIPKTVYLRIPSRDIETEKPSQLTRKENANFRTSKKKNEKIWILKTVYGKHSIYFSDFLKKFKFSDRPFGEVLW